jgi:polar amino acid transport system substrate-binding protein
MKRAWLLILGLFVLLSACTHMQQGAPGGMGGPVLDRIATRGELLVGTAANMPPLNATTKDGQIIGIEPDLAQLIADSMGVKLKMVPMSFSELLAAVQDGRVDMAMSQITITGDRNMKVAFVGPYFISGKSFLTKTETIANAKDASEVNHSARTVVALAGSTSERFVRAMIPKAKLTLTKDYDEAVDLVIKDKADAMVADYPICILSVLRHPSDGLTSLITPLTYEPIGIAVPAQDPLLVNWLDNFLTTYKNSGALKALKEKWLEDGSWVERLK